MDETFKSEPSQIFSFLEIKRIFSKWDLSLGRNQEQQQYLHFFEILLNSLDQQLKRRFSCLVAFFFYLIFGSYNLIVTPFRSFLLTLLYFPPYSPLNPRPLFSIIVAGFIYLLYLHIPNYNFSVCIM